MKFFIMILMIGKLFHGDLYNSGANGENRTHTPKPERDFKSRASTYSATLAHVYIKSISKEMVARDRIELSTQGFSILCSTDWAIGPLLLLIKKWWWEKDSNLRSRRRRIYSPQDLTTLQPHHNEKVLKLIWMGY